MYDFMFKSDKQPQKPTYGVGFFEGIEEQIPGGVLLRAAVSATKEGVADQSQEEFLLQVVMKSIQELTYQEFQELQPYLFCYEAEQTAKVPIVRPLEATQEEFELIRAAPEDFFLKLPSRSE